MEMTVRTTSGQARRPLVIAHRGASAEAPENTIAAFELAVEHGADGIEFEVQLTGDEQPVVIHDFTLDRTTDGIGYVRDRTVRELKRLDVGKWRGSRFQGQRIQTLQEVLERFRDRTRFWIEVKADSDQTQGIEDKVVSMIEVYDVLDRVLVLSPDRRMLGRIGRLNSEIRVGVLTREPTDALRPLDPTIHAVCPPVQALSRQALDDIRHAALDCYVWTVNEPAQMDRLVEWGVDGVITDVPRILRTKLGG